MKKIISETFRQRLLLPLSFCQKNIESLIENHSPEERLTRADAIVAVTGLYALAEDIAEFHILMIDNGRMIKVFKFIPEV